MKTRREHSCEADYSMPQLRSVSLTPENCFAMSGPAEDFTTGEEHDW